LNRVIIPSFFFKITSLNSYERLVSENENLSVNS
jgi:hypothetical protein